ncbi:MAG: hypothetical protein RH942_18725 [Kiloniellaceae bacterium]
MTVNRQGLYAFVFATFAVSWILAPSADAAEVGSAEQKLVDTLSAVEFGTRDSSSASGACVGYMAAIRDARTMRYTMAGLLQVEPDDAVTATCQALVTAVGAGRFSASGFRELTLGSNLDAVSYEFGRFMRAVYFAHRELSEMNEPNGVDQ